MAEEKRRFTVNSNRIDPYRNFRFRMMVASALGAIAGLGLLKKLFGTSTAKQKPTGPTPEPVAEGSRPIDAIGTSTAGRAKPKRKRSPAGGSRKRSAAKNSGARKRR